MRPLLFLLIPIGLLGVVQFATATREQPICPREGRPSSFGGPGGESRGQLVPIEQRPECTRPITVSPCRGDILRRGMMQPGQQIVTTPSPAYRTPESHGERAQNAPSDAELSQTIESFRQQTLQKLDDHFAADPNCEFRRLVPAIRTAEIRIGYLAGARAWALVKENAVGFSRDEYWDVENAFETWLHEAYHLTEKGGAWWCGADEFRKSAPICTVQGRDIYQSVDIDFAIQAHPVHCYHY